MRRAIPVIIATAGGAALLATFHSTPEGGGISAVTAITPDRSTTPSSIASPSTTALRRPLPTTTTEPTRTIDGRVVDTRWGPVQVRVTLRGAALLDVEALVLPTAHPRSAEISRQAGPLLRAEALRAQSANINIVSGASYTSVGYAESLQAALDQAGA